jgi:hypothetical protein
MPTCTPGCTNPLGFGGGGGGAGATVVVVVGGGGAVLDVVVVGGGGGAGAAVVVVVFDLRGRRASAAFAGTSTPTMTATSRLMRRMTECFERVTRTFLSGSGCGGGAVAVSGSGPVDLSAESE